MNVKQVGLFITLLLIIVSIVMALPASKTKTTENQQNLEGKFLLPLPFPLPLPFQVPGVPLKEVSFKVPDWSQLRIAGIPYIRQVHKIT